MQPRAGGGQPDRDGPGHVILGTEYTPLDAAYVAALLREDHDEAERLSVVLDNPRRHVGGASATSAALFYAVQMGWPVFPCLPGEKRPVTTHGFKDATISEQQVRDWWTETPDANIATPTGKDFDVIDFDGGEESAFAFRDAIADGDFPQIIGITLTPRGMHLYVPATGRGNKTAYLPGVDYRGDGGYVVVPPGRTDKGTYSWLLPPERT